MNSTVAFIRHGAYHQTKDTPSALQPYPLTAEGKQQALDCASKIKNCCEQLQLTLDNCVHTSVSLRAWQTASLVVAELSKSFPINFEIKQSEALCERMVGGLANLSINEIEGIITNDPRFENLPSGWKSNSHYRLPSPGAESLMDAGKRVAQYIESTRNQNEQLTLYVGHGAAFRHAAFHLGILEESEISKLSMFHAQAIMFQCDNTLQWQRISGNWKIRKPKTEGMD